jgi:hypothetical protein
VAALMGMCCNLSMKYRLKKSKYCNIVPWLPQKDLFAAYGTSMKKATIKLFRINDGKQGCYIANIKESIPDQ